MSKNGVAEYSIINYSPEILFILDEGCHFVNVSSGTERLTGYSRDELSGKDINLFMEPGTIGIFSGQIRNLKAGLAVGAMKCYLVCRDSSRVGISLSVSLSPDEALIFCIAKQTAVTCEIDKENGQEEPHSLLFAANPLPILIFDTKSLEICNANQAAARLYGYVMQELLELTLKDLSVPEEASLIEDTLCKKSSGYNIEPLGIWTHLKNNGGSVKVEMIGQSIRYRERDCVMAVCHDITALSETLRSLELSIERFEYVTEATSDIIWDWNLESNEVTYSVNIQKAFGHTPGPNEGDMRFFAQHVHPDDRERVVLYPNPVKYGTMKYWGESYRFRKANGEYAFVQDKGIVIRDGKGIGIRMIGAMQDITELKNTELKIAEQNEQLTEHAHKLHNLNTLKDRLIAILAHDLRGPLSSLRGLFELLQDESISHEQLLQMIPGVVKKLDYTSDFLDTLLSWINSHMEDFEKSVKKFSVNGVIAFEAENLDDLAAKKYISLDIDVPDNLYALADPDAIRIVIRNLVTNAIKFSEKGDSIRVSAKKEDGYILVSVQDTGIGMTPEQSAKLFKSKVDSKIGTQNESGTGMGLLFCNDLVEKFKGTIDVSSEPGVGTEFRFTIPEAV